MTPSLHRKKILAGHPPGVVEQEEAETLTWDAEIMIDKIVLSLIADVPGALVEASIISPFLYLSSSDIYRKVELTIWDMQLVNLLPATPFRTLLRPLRPPLSSSRSLRSEDEGGNFLHLTAVKVRGVGDLGADYFKYVGIAVQPFDVHIEGAILVNLLAFKDRIMQALKVSPDAADTSAEAALATLFPSSFLFEPPASTENKFVSCFSGCVLSCVRANFFSPL